MVKVAKRPEALADLEKIWLESAEQYGLQHAEKLIERFDRMFGLLEEFPTLGRARPDLGDNIRFVPVPGYPFLIFFEATETRTEIVRVLHARMEHGSELRR